MKLSCTSSTSSFHVQAAPKTGRASRPAAIAADSIHLQGPYHRAFAWPQLSEIKSHIKNLKKEAEMRLALDVEAQHSFEFLSEQVRLRA